MHAGEMVLDNLEHAPPWPMLRMAFVTLLADLEDDPRYGERVKYIDKLLADPRLPKVGQIYFVPR